MREEPILSMADYSLEELRQMIQKASRYYPVQAVGGVPLHEVMSSAELPGEVFRCGPVRAPDGRMIELEGSNLGRVRLPGGPVLAQFESPPGYDFLCVSAEGQELPVHQVIAALWHAVKGQPVGGPKDLQVHHLTNNGYDNRPSNLLWVTPEEHALIHGWDGPKPADGK